MNRKLLLLIALFAVLTFPVLDSGNSDLYSHDGCSDIRKPQKASPPRAFKSNLEAAAPQPHSHGGSCADDHGQPQKASPPVNQEASIPCAGGDGHAHGHGHSHRRPDAGTIPMDELLKIECSHSGPMYRCGDCRYEIGAVRVDQKLRGLIKAGAPEFRNASDEISFTGELVFDDNRLACVTPRFAGRIISISSRVGDKVEAGQTLVEIESQELAAAALEYLKQQAQLTLSRQTFSREELLHSRKVGSAQSVEQARAALNLNLLKVKNAKHRLMMFGIAGSQIKKLSSENSNPMLLGRMKLTSPISGRIITRQGNIGDMVPPDHELFTVADISSLWAIARVHEMHIAAALNAISQGSAQAELVINAFPGRKFSAEAFGADPVLDPSTRTLPFRMTVENPLELLRPGMFFRGSFRFAGDGFLTLPNEAVMIDEDVEFVFLRYDSDTFFRRDIVTGARFDDRIAVIQGLNQGDSVAIEGAFLLKSDILREKMGAGCAD